MSISHEPIAPEHDVSEPDLDTSADPDLPPGHYADDAEGISRAGECFSFLRSVPILYEIDDTALWDLARHATTCTFQPGERVVAEGTDERTKQFYVIRGGSADVLRRDRGGHERTVARLSVGSYFGELGLLTNQARNATIRVHGTAPLQTYAFDALVFHRRIAEQVLAFRTLRMRLDGIEDDDVATLAPMTPTPADEMETDELVRSGLLDRLPPADLEFVMQHAEHRWHTDGDAIITQGEPGDRFYVLLGGDVSVDRDEREMARLHAGDFFGETALLLDMPRTATVRASGNAHTWSITRSAFQRMVGSYLLANPRTQDEIMRRLSAILPETHPPSTDGE